MKKQRRKIKSTANRVAQAFETQKVLAEMQGNDAKAVKSIVSKEPERVVVKTILGDIDLGFDTDREIIDQEVAQSVINAVRKGGTPADRLALASMAHTNFDLVAIVADILARAGVDKERIDVFTEYAFVAGARKRTTSMQVASINSFFHHELAHFGIQGYYPRSVLIPQADIRIWVRSFVDIVVPFIRDYKLPVLEGQILNLEKARDAEKRNMEMIQRGLQFSSEQEQATILAGERPLPEDAKPLDTPVEVDIRKV